MIARELAIPTVIFYGEEEGRQYPSLKKRCEETANLAKRIKLIIVKNASHKLDHPEYMETVKKELIRTI